MSINGSYRLQRSYHRCPSRRGSQTIHLISTQFITTPHTTGISHLPQFRSSNNFDRPTISGHFVSKANAKELLGYNYTGLRPKVCTCRIGYINWKILTNHARYNYLAAQHDCVKYALVSFAAYIHFQATKSPVSEDVCIRHATAALRELQREINHFGASNADAIVTASVALAGTAKDW